MGFSYISINPRCSAFAGHETISKTVTKAIDKTYGLEPIVTSDYQEAPDWLYDEKNQGELNHE
jgi:hypothetical protein